MWGWEINCACAGGGGYLFAFAPEMDFRPSLGFDLDRVCQGQSSLPHS